MLHWGQKQIDWVCAGLAVLALGVLPGVGSATATTQPAVSAGATATAPVASVPQISVDGFRSAKFGMDEAAVRAAISADFGLNGDKIINGDNAVERTAILTISVPDLIKDGGIAQVSYVLGYSSHKLIQVGASWSARTDPDMTPKMLYDNGDVLRSHFLAAGYAPDSVKSNVALPNGILMFRGADANGHATLLLLQGTFAKAVANGRRTLTPTSLDLLYSENPNAPDIFKLPEGSF